MALAGTMFNVKIYAAGYDLSGDSNEIALDYGCELKDGSTFGTGTTLANVPGRLTFSASAKGLWQAIDPATGPSVDPTLFSNLGLANVLFTVAPLTGAAGELAYFTRSVEGQYTTGAAVGDLMPFSLDVASVGDPLLNGLILESATKTSTWNGTASAQQTAVTSTQYIYAAMHVLSVSGTNPTLDLIVQSAAAANFSTPHTKVTFAQATAVGGQYATPVAGPDTDTYWRVVGTIGGTNTPTFKVAVILGIR